MEEMRKIREKKGSTSSMRDFLIRMYRERERESRICVLDCFFFFFAGLI